jgi:hypothetical protein
LIRFDRVSQCSSGAKPVDAVHPIRASITCTAESARVPCACYREGNPPCFLTFIDFDFSFLNLRRRCLQTSWVRQPTPSSSSRRMFGSTLTTNIFVNERTPTRARSCLALAYFLQTLPCHECLSNSNCVDCVGSFMVLHCKDRPGTQFTAGLTAKPLYLTIYSTGFAQNSRKHNQSYGAAGRQIGMHTSAASAPLFATTL